MITTIKQAKAVQQRRVDAGKKGFAKAVRRFANRHEKSGRGTYRDTLSDLPHVFPGAETAGAAS